MYDRLLATPSGGLCKKHQTGDHNVWADTTPSTIPKKEITRESIA